METFPKISIFITFFVFGDGLEEIPVRDNFIFQTDAIIRDTVNRIFSTLNLKRIQEKPRLQEYVTLHKYFVALSLQEEYGIKKLFTEVKAKRNYKNTYYNVTDFIAIINEVIKEDKTNLDYTDAAVITHINDFLNRLKILKEKHAVNKAYVNINTEVLNHLRNVKHTNKSLEEDKEDLTKEDIVIDSENEFWEPSGRRIYKGQRTKIKHFPFMASVHIFNNFHCAGSIIKSDLIITASSCLQLAWNNRFFRENPAFLSVRVGSSFYSGGGEVIPILEIYFHPGYDPKTLRNNLCILRLSRHLKFKKRSRRVKRIDIDRNPWNLPLTTPITILGWGAKGRSGIIFNPFKNILSFAVLDIYPLRDCQDVYTKEYVTHKHFCAGFISKGGGACNRDVGGPGVVDGKLMGVISFGSPTCGTPDAPTVFTKLGHYTDWIEDIMELNVPVSYKKTTEKSTIDVAEFMPTDKPTTTTFKIPPLNGDKMDALSILDIDKALRLLDENLFKEFLSTMFSSSEIDKYKSLVQAKHKTLKETTTTEQTITENNKASISLEGVEFVTKIPDFDDVDVTEAVSSDRSETKEISKEESEENDDVGQTQKSFSNAPKEAPFTQEKDSKLESDILKFMQNIDLKKIIQEEATVMPQANLNSKPDNESLVTFLYVTDSEKSHKDEEEQGLSIAADNKFEDLTRSKHNDNATMEENELYGILSDVIEKEVENKIINDY